MTLGRVLRALLVVGMLLMPFSTGAGEDSVVVAFGLVPLALLAALLAAGVLLRPQFHREVGGAWLAGALLALALAIGTVYAPRPVATLARSGAGIIGFCVYLFVLSPFYPRATGAGDGRRRAPRSEDAVLLLIAGGTVMAVYFLIHYAAAVATRGLAYVVVDRTTGGAMSLPWGSSNVVASCFLLPILLTFYAGRREVSRGRRWAMLVARLLMSASIVATLSRGALAALLLGLMVHTLVAGRGRRAGLVWGFAAALGAVVAVDWYLGGALGDQAVTLLASRLDASKVAQLNGRTGTWVEFGRLWLESPLVGVGYYGSMTVAGGTGHSVFLTTLVERGLLGTLCSVGVLLLAAWRALAGRFAARRSEDRLLFAALLSGGTAALVHLMVEDANLTHQYIVFSWLGLSIPVTAWWERVESPPAAPVPPPALPSAVAQPQFG